MAPMTQREASAAVARVLKLAKDMDTEGATEVAALIRQAVSGREKPPETPGQLAGRGEVARWLIEDIGEDAIKAQMRKGGTAKDKHGTLAQQVARIITDAVVRYGWDRPADELERTPPPPMPTTETHGDGKVLLSWEISPRCRAEWAEWWRNRPGRNAGLGGRPRHDASAPAATPASS